MSFDAELLAHLSQPTSTVCHCWRLLRLDGQKMGFTDHDEDVSFDDTLFHASTGAQGSEQEYNGKLSADNGELLGAISHDSLNHNDIENGIFDRAEIEIFMVNWQNVDQRTKIASGAIGEIKQIDGAWTAEIRGLGDEYSANKARYYTRRCNARIGDKNCKVEVDQSQFSAVGRIEKRIGDYSLVVSDLHGFETGFFAGGNARLWGANVAEIDEVQGTKIGIIQHHPRGSDAILSAWQKWPVGFDAGQQIYLTAGCDGSFSTCRKKFDNALNFQGFPHIPGNDFLIQNAANLSVHDGGALIADDD